MKHARLAFAFLIMLAAMLGDASAADADRGALDERIVVDVKQLGYSEEVGTALADLAGGWQTDDGAPLVEKWQAALADARRKHDDGTLSDEKLAEAELAVIRELAATLVKEIKHKRRTGALTLDVMIEKKTAQSVAYAQAAYVLGNALGLRLDPIAVTYPIRDEQPMLSGHCACLGRLADGTTVLIDPSFDPAVTEPFDFGTAYGKDDGFFVLADGAKMPGLHRRLRVLDDDGFRAAVYVGRAETEYNKSHWKKAREHADRAIELDAGSAVAYRARAMLRTVRGEYDEAIDDAQKALALDAEYAEAWNTIACDHWMQDNTAEALEAFAKALDMNPAYASPYLNRAYMLLAQGKRDEAEADAAKALEIAPRDVQVVRWRATFCSELGEPEQAIEAYTAAISLDPEYAIAYAERAAVLVGLGKREEAFADCAKAIELEPDDAIVRVSVGYALFEADEGGKALEQFSKAVKLEPELAMARYWRAESLRGRGDSRLTQIAVLRGLTKTIELDPRFAPAYVSRGDFHVDHDEPEKGLEDLNTAIELAPWHDWAYACRAGAHVELGDYESALEDLDRAIEITPTSGWYYYKRGRCHAELGYDEEAVEDWRKAIELDPKTASWVKRAADEYGLEIEEDD